MFPCPLLLRGEEGPPAALSEGDEQWLHNVRHIHGEALGIVRDKLDLCAHMSGVELPLGAYPASVGHLGTSDGLRSCGNYFDEDGTTASGPGRLGGR